MNSLYGLILFVSLILLFCIAFSRYLTRAGIPVLVFFIFAGMLMGSEGIGGIYFDDANAASSIGNFAICFILFAGGMATSWTTARSVLTPGILLATVGVVLTALMTACAAHFITGMSWSCGLFLGSVVSCTDAASVFSILRSNNLNLKSPLAPLLELESSSNDPAAYLMTIMVASYITSPDNDFLRFIITFAQQFIIGGVLGYILGKAGALVINKIHVNSDGLYPVIAVTIAAITYSAVQICHGNGFLGVYISGLVIGNVKLTHKTVLVRFFDGISWLMQILVFVTLGLLVFPHELTEVWKEAVIVSAVLMFVIRPAAVFLTLIRFKYSAKAKLFISWVGLRGASSIVFATYAFTNNLPDADLIFNTVFFISLMSVIIQGSMLSRIAAWLDQVDKNDTNLVSRSFTDYEEELGGGLFELCAAEQCSAVGKKLMELNFPEGIRIMIIKRAGGTVTPIGKTVIKLGDKLMVTANDAKSLLKLKERFRFS